MNFPRDRGYRKSDSNLYWIIRYLRGKFSWTTAEVRIKSEQTDAIIVTCENWRSVIQSTDWQIDMDGFQISRDLSIVDFVKIDRVSKYFVLNGFHITSR